MKPLVIGYGNPLRGDDGAGPFVASQIGAGAIACHQLTPELAETISQAGQVIFADADASVPPGQIAIRPIRPRASTSIHRFDPETLLDWSQQLYGRVPEALLIGIGGESFGLGEGLSPAAKRATYEALRAIRQIKGAATDSRLRRPEATVRKPELTHSNPTGACPTHAAVCR